MIHSLRFTCVLDTNVIYPIDIRDLLFWFAFYDLYTPKWSKHIFSEWEDVMRRKEIPDALNRGKDDLIKIIAHEFRHNYRVLTAQHYTHPLMIQLTKIHQEGVADLIDKDKPPIQGLSLYPKTVIDMYNSDYNGTPQKLKNLDSLTNGLLTQEIDSLTYFGQIENYFGFGGHTNGFYMSLKIVEKGSLQVLIDSYHDPVEFIRIYNGAAKEASGDHVFSSKFVDYVEQIE